MLLSSSFHHDNVNKSNIIIGLIKNTQYNIIQYDTT